MTKVSFAKVFILVLTRKPKKASKRVSELGLNIIQFISNLYGGVLLQIAGLVSILCLSDSLIKPSLTSLVDYHWATAGIRVNSSSAYELSFVPAQGESNISDDTKGWLCTGYTGSAKSLPY